MAFVVKFIILLAFFVLVFLTIEYFLKRLVFDTKDKKSLQLLVNLGFIIAVVLIILYFYALNILPQWKFLLAVLGAIVLGYIVFVLIRRKLDNFIFLIKKRLEYGDFVEYNNQVYRFLTVHKNKVLLEDINGQVVEIEISPSLDIKKLEKGLGFVVDTQLSPEQISRLVEKNPFVPAHYVAVFLEEDISEDRPVLKIYIKQCDSFQKFKEFKRYIQSHL